MDFPMSFEEDDTRTVVSYRYVRTPHPVDELYGPVPVPYTSSGT